MSGKEKFPKFPRTVYSNPGPNKWGKDKTYDAKIVKDETEYNAAIEAGYIDSFHDALFGETEKKKDPTKAEIVAELKRANIEFDPKASKEDLLKLLAESEGE